MVSNGGIKILDYNNIIDDDYEWLEVENSNIFPEGSNTNIWSLAFSRNLNEDILWIQTGNGIKGYIVNNLELTEYPQTFYENIPFDQFDKCLFLFVLSTLAQGTSKNGHLSNDKSMFPFPGAPAARLSRNSATFHEIP